MLSDPLGVVASLGRHLDALVAALAPDFYVNVAAVREAVDRRASFNLIHLATMFKADVFVVWFRLGSDTSERQWRDVLGLLEVQ